MIVLGLHVQDINSVMSQYTQIRIYRDTAQNGPFSPPPIGVVNLVADQTDYEFFDPAGNNSSWYKASYYNPAGPLESNPTPAMLGGPLVGPLGVLTPDVVRSDTDFAGLANLSDTRLGQYIFRAESMLQRFADRYGGWNSGVPNFTQTLTMLARIVLEELWVRSSPGARTANALGTTMEKIGTYTYQRRQQSTSNLSPWDIRTWFSPEVVDALRTIVSISPTKVRMQTSLVFSMLDPIPDPTLPFEMRPYWDGLDEELLIGNDPLHQSQGTRRVIIYPQR